MKNPVALFIFKRPKATQKVFEVIRQARPKQLFVLADAPRSDRPDEAEKCAATRAIIDQVDWDCEVVKRFAETNQGLGKQFSNGLSWLFNQVENAIILEDDCVVDPSFFRFSEEMLDRYRDDQRVFSIAAQNDQPEKSRTPYSYYFSRYPHIWGWATWRRAWQNYDYSMSQWSRISQTPFLKDLLETHSAVEYWTEHFQKTYDGIIQTWDYQWTLACWLQSGLSVIPSANLVHNIGFDEDATNFKTVDPQLINPAIDKLEFPLRHPPYVLRHAKADVFTQNRVFEGGTLRQAKRWVKRSLKTQFPEIQWKFST